MTPAQLIAIKAIIIATPEWASQPMSVAGAVLIREDMNALASPNFTVWKSVVNPDDIMRNGMDWTRVDNLTVGKARIWDWMTRLGTFNPSKANIRAAIDATWVGTAQDLAVRAQVYVHCKRLASVVEKLYATGTGSDADPGVMGYEGPITVDEIVEAREIP